MSSYGSSAETSIAPLGGDTWMDEVKRSWQTPDKARYDYCALESERHIRLLHMIIEEPKPLPRLRIIHVPLDSAPNFEALSYCWGDDTQLYHIPVETDGNSDTRSIPSTDSLATAMLFLPRSCSTGYLWIDQICINQQDDNERGHQIALMGEIYSRATQVLVWLGPGLGVDNNAKQTSASSAGLKPPINVDDVDIDLDELMGFNTVRELFENEWYQRAWVVQESCLARSKRALIGTFSLRWDILFLRVLQIPMLDSSKHLRHVSTSRDWNMIQKFGDNKPREFCGFMARYVRSFKASNPKDKVLAFLGLWKPPDFDTKAATRKEETAANVYIRFATSLIKHTKGLDVLAAVYHKPLGREGGSTICALPSWVPNWEYDTDYEVSPLFREPDDIKGPAHEWEASRSRNHQYQFESPTGAELWTRGRVLWKIGYVCHQIKRHPNDPVDLESTQQALGLTSGGLSIAVPDALRILLLCRRRKRTLNFYDFGPGLRGPRGIAILRRYFSDDKTESEARNQIEGLPEYDSSTEPDRTPVGSQEHSDESIIDKFETIWFACYPACYSAIGKRFFEVQRPWNEDVEGVEGRVGLGPGCTETGDEVAILHGANFPVVLRKIKGREQSYQMIGDCYVDRVMFGEAVDWEEEDADDIILV